MTDESEIDEQIEDGKPRRESGGASIYMRDGRVSRALGWFWGIVGTGLVGSVLLAANNLYELNLTVARGVANDALAESRYQDQEGRIRQLERDVNSIQGRIFRGPRGEPDGDALNKLLPPSSPAH